MAAELKVAQAEVPDEKSGEVEVSDEKSGEMQESEYQKLFVAMLGGGEKVKEMSNDEFVQWYRVVRAFLNKVTASKVGNAKKKKRVVFRLNRVSDESIVYASGEGKKVKKRRSSIIGSTSV